MKLHHMAAGEKWAVSAHKKQNILLQNGCIKFTCTSIFLQ